MNLDMINKIVFIIKILHKENLCLHALGSYMPQIDNLIQSTNNARISWDPFY